MRTSPERIVDVVFEGERAPSGRRGVVGLAFGVGAHVLLLLAALRGGPTLEAWAADVSVRVHAELTRTEVVEPPKDETPEASPPPASPLVRKAPSFTAEHAAPAHEHRATGLHDAPPPEAAEAGRVLAEDDAAPADLTGETFVVGDGAGYAGGATRADGTSREAVSGLVGTATPSALPAPSAPAPRPARDDGADASRPVKPAGGWSCAWPREAESEALDTQSAVVRITVGADGRVESAAVEADPGFGFGRAALECARAMRYAPALDRSGSPIRATTSIRVRFWR